MRALRVLPLLIVAGCADDPPPVATVAPASPPPVVPAAADPDTEPDPVRRRTRIEETWFRTNFPVEGHSLRFHDLRPFLVGEFVPDARSDAPPDGGRGYAEVLPAVLAEVRRFFREVAGVELPPLEDLGDERLRWLVFPDRRQFDAWHARLGRLPMDAPYVQVGADGLAVVPGDEVSPHTLAWLAATQSIARWKRHLCQQDDDAVADAKGQPRKLPADLRTYLEKLPLPAEQDRRRNARIGR